MTYTDSRQVRVSGWLPHYCGWGLSPRSGQFPRVAAAVLTDLFGSKVFTDTTHTDHHLMPLEEARSLSSFDEAAQEAVASRLYGGIPFPFDNDGGLSAGQCIGRAIIDRVHLRDEDND